MKQAFLSYARQNKAAAKRLFDDLTKTSSVSVWADFNDLLPGMRWKPAIRKAIRESRWFIALLSCSAVSSKGFRQTELREAMRILKEFPEDWIFLIPTRLDECRMPAKELQELHYADLFPEWSDGIKQILRAFKVKPPSGKKRTSKAKKTALIRQRVHTKRRHQYIVGLADLDASAPELTKVVRGLNAAQSLFLFKPSPLKNPIKAAKIIDGNRQLYIPALQKSFYELISPLNMDFVICLTRRLLAFEKRGRICYNYLTTQSPIDERVFFISYAGLREYAQQAAVGFDVALAFLIIGELTTYFIDVDYHPETRGCPLDFTEDHADLVKGLLAGRFCRSCSRRLDKNKELRAAVSSMLAWGR